MYAPPVHSTNPDHRRVCLAAGLLLLVLPRLPPVKAVVNFSTRLVRFLTRCRDPQQGSRQPGMTAAGWVSDALLVVALFHMLPFAAHLDLWGRPACAALQGPPR